MMDLVERYRPDTGVWEILPRLPRGMVDRQFGAGVGVVPLSLVGIHRMMLGHSGAEM